MTLIIFLLALVEVFLLAFNARNAAQGRYLVSGTTSVAIGFLWVLSIKLLSEQHFTPPLIAAHVIGGAIGSTLGVYVHKKALKPKRPEEW